MNELIDRMSRLARPLLGSLGVVWLSFGLWAFLGPHSFFDLVAEFEPYNRHFIHDVGAMQIGLGAGALAAALTLRAVVSGLIGLAAFQSMHAVSHLVDHDLGGNPWFDIPALSGIATVGIGALIGALRTDPRHDQH